MHDNIADRDEHMIISGE